MSPGKSDPDEYCRNPHEHVLVSLPSKCPIPFNLRAALFVMVVRFSRGSGSQVVGIGGDA